MHCRGISTPVEASSVQRAPADARAGRRAKKAEPSWLVGPRLVGPTSLFCLFCLFVRSLILELEHKRVRAKK